MKEIKIHKYTTIAKIPPAAHIEGPSRRNMAEHKPLPVHTNNIFEDLSGISTSSFSNPYDALIAASEDDSVCYSEVRKIACGTLRLTSIEGTDSIKI